MRPLIIPAFAALAALASSGVPAQTPAHPFPQHLPYAAGSIRPSHRSQAQLDQDVREAYARWKTAYLRTAGSDGGLTLYRVLCDTDSAGNTVSEGQGYGLVIVALMAGAETEAAAISAGLWRYADLHPSGNDSRLMSWNINAAGQVQQGNTSAFDGDNDLALGLLLAAAQWPGGANGVDFRARALEVIAGQAASAMGPASYLPLLGDWVTPNGAQYNQYTVRPSDFMPAHFVNFAAAANAPLWMQAVAAARAATEHLQGSYAANTGLMPDFAVRESAAVTTLRPADPGFLEGANDGNYNYNAGRVPWRLATHALLHSDVASARQARRISQWAQASTGGVATNIRPGYRLDGTPLATDYFSSFFAAPIGTAAMVTPAQQSWLNAIYDSVRTRQEGYYEDSVALLSLLLMSGTYWDPVAMDRLFADGLQRITP
ncbi:glycosyl hydrolase family 8 [Tahibacter harae]|uniref:cellulase n=1 Tax=Tahibacter harae TaxID=2963937 RepID=A0ABT1QNP1_9GAMM|nr:glycosyl hydrolase family 8 [Tahibacter harae]MCQ4163668.1 glycosyl hydrolase family 8 [Tahibacter harae]